VSGPSQPLPRGFAGGLPERFRPRESEDPGRGQTRLVETTVLVLVALFLAIATANDLVRQTHVNHRLVADLRTWRQYTGHDYKNVSLEQDLYGHTTRDIACGNVSPGAPKARTQLCIVLTGPVRAGRRAAHGGFYLPPKVDDVRRDRYGCYGSAKAAGLCPR
jgi:cell division protein FtsL